MRRYHALPVVDEARREHRVLRLRVAAAVRGSGNSLPCPQGFNDIQIQRTAQIVDDTLERDQEARAPRRLPPFHSSLPPAAHEAPPRGFQRRWSLKPTPPISPIPRRPPARRQVVKIIESVNELAQIMKDLAVLVIDQGTILDRIDYNIQQVAASVEDGVEQIKKADEHQKQSKIFVIITCLAASIILMIIIVIAKKAIMG